MHLHISYRLRPASASHQDRAAAPPSWAPPVWESRIYASRGTDVPSETPSTYKSPRDAVHTSLVVGPAAVCTMTTAVSADATPGALDDWSVSMEETMLSPQSIAGFPLSVVVDLPEFHGFADDADLWVRACPCHQRQ